MGVAPDANDSGPAADPPVVAEGLSLAEAAHTRQFWTTCAANLFLVACFMSTLVHIVPLAIDLGVGGPKAAGVLSAIGGVSMASRFVSGFVIDRIGCRRVMMFCAMMLIVALLWLQFASALWMLYLFAAIQGIALGGCFTAISPLVAELFGIRFHGGLFGIVAFSGTFGGAVGPVLAGFSFDVTGGYAPAIWLGVLVSGLGFVLVSSLKPITDGAVTVGAGRN